jgi:hypothetical protein
MNLINDVKVTKVLGYSAAGVAAKTSKIVDMQGFAGVIFIATLGAVVNGANITLQAKEDVVNPMTNSKNLAGGAANFIAGANDSDKCLIVDVYRPSERYLNAVITPTIQNAEITSMIAIQYQANCKPTVQDLSVIASAAVVSPSEF